MARRLRELTGVRNGGWAASCIGRMARLWNGRMGRGSGMWTGKFIVLMALRLSTRTAVSIGLRMARFIVLMARRLWTWMAQWNIGGMVNRSLLRNFLKILF